jgi:hypothetical protein
MAEKVVAGQDVVHLEALAAGEALADVALKQGVVRDELLPFSIAEDALVGRSCAGLALEWS